MQVEVIDAAIDESHLVDFFDEWWAKWPSGQKTGKKDALRAWLKVFKKDPGIPQHDWKEFAKNVLIQAIDNQCSYRKSVYRKYPSSEERKRHDIFVPRLPMPATWLNGGRWMDTVPSLPGHVEGKVSTKMPCTDCSADAAVLVEGKGFCAWHWTKRFNRDHLKLMADSLNRMGLSRLDNESQEAWSDRCREYIRSSKWADAINA
jgi:hypothetical protein